MQDVVQKRPAQGGSTITQQFVKNASQAQGNRTVFEKLREAALAYHLTSKWSKEKILTEYLNSIYFGNGAYGIESAAAPTSATATTRLRRQRQPPVRLGAAARRGRAAGRHHRLARAAIDPIAHPVAAKRRRNIVLANMLEQGRLTRAEYENALAAAAAGRAELDPPRERTDAPYFTTWVRQQLVDRYGPEKAFEGGLKIKTTLDFDMQKAAETAINTYLSDPGGPTASLVAIDNKTGEVRAMVGGRDYSNSSRSTSRPRASASRARRSSRSSWPRRSSRDPPVIDLWPSRSSVTSSCRGRRARSTSSSTTSRAPTPAPARSARR